MNKTEIAYIEKRVNQVVKCTNGRISTKISRKKKGTGLTDNAKLSQIRSGRATLKDDLEITAITSRWGGIEGLLRYYNFEITPKQREKINHNNRLDQAEEEMHTTVELAGRALIDKVVLGVIDKRELPAELGKLSRMFDKATLED